MSGVGATLKGVSDRDFISRRKSVLAAAQGVCGVVNDILFQEYGISEGVRFVGDGKLVENFVKNYFASINQFKKDHNFKDDKLANEAKRAAAWIVAASMDDSVSKFFIFHPEVKASIYKDMLEVYFLYIICCSYLYIDSSFIDFKLENETLHNLLKRRSSLKGEGRIEFMDWMVTQMHAILQLGKITSQPTAAPAP